MKIRSLTKRKDGEKMDGLKLASMYSYNCENAHIYGFQQQLKDFAQKKTGDAKKIRNCITKLESYKFYEIIAKINGMEDPFDQRIISYYWKGTPNLKGELWHNYTTFITILEIPMESIFVKLVDECIVHPAKVIESSENSFLVKYFPAVKIKGKIILGAETEKIVSNSLPCKAAPGDYITIHFSSAVEKINDKELKTLLFITERSLEKFEKARQ